MATTRRTFLSSVAAAGAAFPLAARSAAPARTGAPMKILVLGGTAFLGPHFVRAARARGHEITLFNRGRTNPELFRDLEQLRGDRDKQELEPLKGRQWDAVLDTSGYVPAHVQQAASILKDHVGHYQFISTISVYGAFDQRPERVDEDAATTTVSQQVIDEVKTIRQSFRHYGAMKALCEAAAEKEMPGRVSNVRPGLIVGPMDRSDRFTYWPWRIDRGGEVLCPGDVDGHSQFVDVRDLADWMLHCIEQNVTGVYNAVGFAGRTALSEVLSACKCATASDVRLTWVDEEFLAEHGVRPYSEMPLWIPRAGRRMVQNGKAMEKGLKFRPIADTIRDTLEWAKAERGDKPLRSGMRPEREKELLATWHERQKRTSGK